MDFSELGKGGVRLIRQSILSMLVDSARTDEEVLSAMTRLQVGKAKERLAPFRQSLRLFIHHFIMKRLKNPDPILARRLQLATQALC